MFATRTTRMSVSPTMKVAAEALDAAGALAGRATRVVVEHASRYAAPAERTGLRLTRTVKAGDSALSFYQHL